MSTDNLSVALSDAIDITLLDLSKAEFFMTGGGFTGLRYGDKEYMRVSLRRALPLGDPSNYISVADHENKEIGIIKSLSELSGEQLALVESELAHRYYCPFVYEVRSVKDKLGYVYMELLIGDGRNKKYEKTCAVKDVNRNIRMLGSDKLIIFDVDGNRYILESLEAIDNKSRKRLEPYLF